ncbi:hypothetical protein E2C01_010825 [Portunus trituberculatus]|uniref:Uncharacterized protein n=1 Tax=Portunus trituberculatus TaxID=210409 RepID=A0A5B7D9G1_PORTR|nr:hypothetical protein [Portunus trituberculatus]
MVLTAEHASQPGRFLNQSEESFHHPLANHNAASTGYHTARDKTVSILNPCPGFSDVTPPPPSLSQSISPIHLLLPTSSYTRSHENAKKYMPNLRKYIKRIVATVGGWDNRSGAWRAQDEARAGRERAWNRAVERLLDGAGEGQWLVEKVLVWVRASVR